MKNSVTITGDQGKQKLLDFFSLLSKEKGLTDLHRKTNIPRNHFYTLFSKKGNPTLDTILVLAKALNLSITVSVE